ncbi:MAG TPA: hypothetical protein HA254_06745 [Candidatus Diapherotrites archaeon]|uniref:Uncharacterized protein n=1 Tax=Candidatus Iainarchaeum sp. TaxID=3101447 RepID=A0A7J4IXU5_9ARCH|nr:hypothetical protein [Candidatus Diapherotrites archaeon]
MVDVSKPTKNIMYFLLIVKQLKEVVGRIKLYKLHYLIEREGKVKYDVSISNYPLGPVDWTTANFCTQNGLVEEQLENGIPYDFYKISLTEEGEAFFNKYASEFNRSELGNAKKIIAKYKSTSGTALLHYVHKKYVDGFKDFKKANQIITGFENNVPIIQDLINKNAATIEDLCEKDELQTMNEYLEHVKIILSNLRSVQDPVKLGQVLWTVKEIFDSLSENSYKYNSYIKELFDYLDNYAAKEKIANSITSDDLSDINKDVRERLLQAVAQMEIPLSSSKRAQS